MFNSHFMQGISYLLIPSVTAFSVFFLIIIITPCTPLRNNEAYASNTTTINNSQVWVDKPNNIKIHFAYELNKPTINNLNELNFTVQNLKTGNNLRNLVANVAVLNSPDPTLKFDNVTAADGKFSIKCPFLNEGIHQVIVNIRSNNNYVLALASFNLDVPATNNGY